MHDSALSAWTNGLIRSTAIDSTHCAQTRIAQCRLGTKEGMVRARLGSTQVTMAWLQKTRVLHTSLQTQRGMLGLTVRAPPICTMHGKGSEALTRCCLHMGRAVLARLR